MLPQRPVSPPSASAAAAAASSPYSYQSLSTAITRRRPLHRHPSLPQRRTLSEATSLEPSIHHTPSATSGSQLLDEHNNSNSDDTNTTTTTSTHLKRTLSLTDLIFYGVGCSVGAGIYSLVGMGATLAGPGGIAASFALCGVACIFTSLGYAEFAARVPLAGSAYTFTYVSFGELAGWLVGWNLTLGYAVSASVVARSWASYVVGFVQGILNTTTTSTTSTGSLDFMAAAAASNHTTTVTTSLRQDLSAFLHWSIHAPLPAIFTSSDDQSTTNHGDEEGDSVYECCPLAMLIIFLCTLVLLTGAKESTRFNTAMTILNLSILGFVVLVGIGSGTALERDNLTPLLPHGWQGVGRAAGLVFFSYLGFDMVSCLSEEVKNPERNMPIGIIGSLLSSMFIYCSVSIVVVGMAPLELLGEDIPIVNAMLSNACCTHEEQVVAAGWEDIERRHDTCLSYSCEPVLRTVLFAGSRIVSCGAVFGLTTACFACLMGQPRIFFSMAQDGLLFKIYGEVNPQTGVPTMGTILTGTFTALVACFIDLESLANAISLGTLQVFTFVNAGVIILRMTPPLSQLRPLSDIDAVADEENEHNETTRQKNPMSRHPTHHDERTPLLPDHGGAEIVIDSNRKSQLERLSSERRTATSSDPETNSFDLLKLRKNGSWPHCLTLLFTVCAIWIFAIISNSTDDDAGRKTGTKILLAVLAFTVVLCAFVLTRLPQARPPDTFTCPCVPIVPLFGILCNSYMMGSLPRSTWYAIAVWLLAGVCFYFGYGMHHSELRHRTAVPDKGDERLFDKHSTTYRTR